MNLQGSILPKPLGKNMRKRTRSIQLGSVSIGGVAPVSIQSMARSSTEDISSTVDEIKRLESVGCEIVRVAVPNMKAARVLHQIKENISLPLVADIHFDYRLALEAIHQGVDGLRLNPGNIRRRDKVVWVVEEAKKKSIPIRIGVNGGSIDRSRYSVLNAENLVESALDHVRILEELGYENIKISLKATDIPMTVAAYRRMSEKRDYPLHLGITEAGTKFSGSIKSAIGIGTLLGEGIGDTIRVSLACESTEEVLVAKEILRALHLRREGVECIACPTCGRCEIDVVGITEKIEREVAPIRENLKISVLGCIVNGPGEALESDIGITGGKGMGMLYRKGKAIRRVREEEIVSAVLDEVKELKEVKELNSNGQSKKNQPKI